MSDDVRADAREVIAGVQFTPCGPGCLHHRCEHSGAAMMRNLLAEADRLQSWKDEALPVIFGLQDLGRALDIPLGHSITGPEATEKALALRNERDAALATLQQVRAALDELVTHGDLTPSGRRVLRSILGGAS